jgi:hypothetical protein
MGRECGTNGREEICTYAIDGKAKRKEIAWKI